MLCLLLPGWKANISLASPDYLGAHICDVELILHVTLSASGSNCSAVVLDPTPWLLCSFDVSNDKALDAAY